MATTNLLRYGEDNDLREMIDSNGMIREIKEGILEQELRQEAKDPKGRSSDEVKIDVQGEFDRGGDKGLYKEFTQANNLGLADTVSRDRMGQNVAAATLGFEKDFNKFAAMMEASVAGGGRTGGGQPLMSTNMEGIFSDLSRNWGAHAKTLEVLGHATRGQALEAISGRVVAGGGQSIQEWTDNGLSRQIGNIRSSNLSMQDMEFMQSGSHPQIIAEEAITRKRDYAVNKDLDAGAFGERLTEADHKALGANWNGKTAAEKSRSLAESKQQLFSNYRMDPDRLDADRRSGVPYLQNAASSFDEAKKTNELNSQKTYLSQEEARNAAPESIAAYKTGSELIHTSETINKERARIQDTLTPDSLDSVLEGSKNLGRPLDDAKRSVGDFATVMEKASGNINQALSGVDKQHGQAYAGLDARGRRSGRDKGGADGPMTFSKLTYTSMDNIIGSLSYPLMDQALLQPMMSGMMSSEVMPGFVPKVSGAEEVFNVMSGYLPNMGEDIKELEMRQKSLKAITGSYSTSDKMIQHAVEIAKAEPIQFGTAVQAFTSFSAFPGTREEVKGSQQFRESLTDVIQRLAILVPEQGEQGASFALREILSGQYRSLKQRFNMDLPQLTKAAGESGMSRGKFESLGGAEKIDILQRGLKVMTGETALAERSLTTSVQTEDIKDTLMQKLALRFTQPSGETNLGYSESEEMRMREVFYEQNKRTMGNRLTEDQLWERTQIQVDTAQRSPIGRMAVGLQGMVDVVGTHMDNTGIGASIERSITENIFQPFANVTLGDKSGDEVDKSGSRLKDAIDTLAKGIKDTARDLTGNDDIQGMMKSGIDAMVGTMTSTMIPGLGYGMSAGASASWEAIMNPGTINTIMGGITHTATSDTKQFSDSLATLAPILTTAGIGLAYGSGRSFGMSDENLKKHKSKIQGQRDAEAEGKHIRRSERVGMGQRVKAGFAGVRQMTPDATLRGVFASSAFAAGVGGLLDEEATFGSRVTSGIMGAAGLGGLATMFDSDVRGKDFFTRMERGRLVKGGGLKRAVGPMGVGMLGAGVGMARRYDNSRRENRIRKEQSNFDTQFEGLRTSDDVQDQALFGELVGARNQYRDQGNFWQNTLGAAGAVVGGGVGAFFGLGIGAVPVGAAGGGIGMGIGSSIDAFLGGKDKKEYDELERRAAAKVTYQGRQRRIEAATGTAALATSGDTSRFARDLKMSYDISSGSFGRSGFDKMLEAESEQRRVEQGLGAVEGDIGWREQFGIGSKYTIDSLVQAGAAEGKVINENTAALKIATFEDSMSKVSSDSGFQSVLTRLSSPEDQEDLTALLDSARDEDGRLDFRGNQAWENQAGGMLDNLKEKGLVTSESHLQNFVKMVEKASKALSDMSSETKDVSREKVVSGALSTQEGIDAAKAKAKQAATGILDRKGSAFFLGGNPPPNYFQQSSDGPLGQSRFQHNLENKWTREEYLAKTQTEQSKFLTDTGQELMQAEAQYEGNSRYAQSLASQQGGFFTGHTPDFIKNMQRGMQRTTIDMWAEAGDQGAIDLRNIRTDDEKRLLEEVEKVEIDGKSPDTEKIRRLRAALGANGGDSDLIKRADNVDFRSGLATGMPRKEMIMEAIKNEDAPPLDYNRGGLRNLVDGTLVSDVGYRSELLAEGQERDLSFGTLVSASDPNGTGPDWRRGSFERRALGKERREQQKAKGEEPEKMVLQNFADYGEVNVNQEGAIVADDGELFSPIYKNPGSGSSTVSYQNEAGEFYVPSDKDYATQLTGYQNPKKSKFRMTRPEFEAKREAVDKGRVVDVLDGDTVLMEYGSQQVPVRMSYKDAGYTTDEYGIPRKNDALMMDTQEVFPYFRGEDALAKRYEQGDILLESMGFDTERVDTASLVNAPMEDTRKKMAAMAATIGEDDKEKQKQFAMLMGGVEQGKMTAFSVDGFDGGGIDIKGAQGSTNYNRLLGTATGGDGSDLSRDVVLGQATGSASSRYLHKFTKNWGGRLSVEQQQAALTTASQNTGKDAFMGGRAYTSDELADSSNKGEFSAFGVIGDGLAPNTTLSDKIDFAKRVKPPKPLDLTSTYTKTFEGSREDFVQASVIDAMVEADPALYGEDDESRRAKAAEIYTGWKETDSDRGWTNGLVGDIRPRSAYIKEELFGMKNKKFALQGGKYDEAASFDFRKTDEGEFASSLEARVAANDLSDVILGAETEAQKTPLYRKDVLGEAKPVEETFTRRKVLTDKAVDAFMGDMGEAFGGDRDKGKSFLEEYMAMPESPYEETIEKPGFDEVRAVDTERSEAVLSLLGPDNEYNARQLGLYNEDAELSGFGTGFRMVGSDEIGKGQGSSVARDKAQEIDAILNTHTDNERIGADGKPIDQGPSPMTLEDMDRLDEQETVLPTVSAAAPMDLESMSMDLDSMITNFTTPKSAPKIARSLFNELYERPDGYRTAEKTGPTTMAELKGSIKGETDIEAATRKTLSQGRQRVLEAQKTPLQKTFGDKYAVDVVTGTDQLITDPIQQQAALQKSFGSGYDIGIPGVSKPGAPSSVIAEEQKRIRNQELLADVRKQSQEADFTSMTGLDSSGFNADGIMEYSTTKGEEMSKSGAGEVIGIREEGEARQWFDASQLMNPSERMQMPQPGMEGFTGEVTVLGPDRDIGQQKGQEGSFKQEKSDNAAEGADNLAGSFDNLNEQVVALLNATISVTSAFNKINNPTNNQNVV